MWKTVIIDDDPNLLDGMRHSIPWEELNAEWIGEEMDGRAGLDLITHVNPDIVICDVDMPIMNGLEMIEILRSNHYSGKVVILSGFSEFEYARRALRLDVDDYLSKPVSIDTMKNVLLRVTDDLNAEREQLRNVPHVNHGNPTDVSTSDYMNSGDSPRHRKIVDFIKQYTDQHYMDNLTLGDIADKVNVSKNYLGQIFKGVVNQSYNSYLTQVRMEKAKAMLSQENLYIYEVAEKVGYNSISYFSTQFKKYTGKNPTDLH